MDPIRVMIVDDHAVVRRGLGAYLTVRDELQLVGEAGSGQEALDLLPSAQPDVVLMDISMPGMSGIEAAQLICHRYPHVAVLMLTSYPDPQLALSALQVGASGFLIKDISVEDLAAAIRLAHHGYLTLVGETASVLATTSSERSSTPYDITGREQEVLALVAQGMSNAEIAHLLSLSVSTVKFHLGNLMAKLNAGSRTEAVAIAMQHGLLDVQG